ncbi:MAG: hypothetical protein IKU52_00545, partial [Clostridia bacterium]|nr:hypothetical protein [Clostridia bacterium]
WMMYKNAAREDVKTSGLSLIRGVTVFNLVMVCIAAVLAGLCCIIVLIVGAASEPMILGVGIAITIIFAAVLIYMILLLSKSVKIIETVSDTLKTGQPGGKISTFVGVSCYIFGVICAIGALVQLFISPVAFVINGVYATSCILFGVVIDKYKQMIKAAAAEIPQPIEPIIQNNINI